VCGVDLADLGAGAGCYHRVADHSVPSCCGLGMQGFLVM
jgi:hypothetical protein